MTGRSTAFADRYADRKTVLKGVLGFVVALVLVYLLGVVVGWRRVVATLAGADVEWFLAACLSTIVGLAAWSKAWQVVLGVAGIEIRDRRLFVTYLAATFANYVTPFGQAGGEPFVAFVLAEDTGASYEDSLASVVTADLLNLLPFFNFAAVGFAVLLWRAQLPAVVRPLAAGVAVVAVAIPALAYLGWSRRGAVESVVLRATSFVGARTGLASVSSVRRRIDRFYATLAIIATEPRRLVYALVFSYVGWVLFAAPLYLAGSSLGLSIDPLVVLFVVPASTIAGFVPTPGGLAGVETALVVLLVALVGFGAAEALAVTTVYRLASYWLVILVGGITSVYVISRA